MATKKNSERVIVNTYFEPNDFEIWKKHYIDYCIEEEIEYNENDLIERYYEDVSLWVDDEKTNLNKTIDGVIIAFADLGLWNGRRDGARKFTDKINSIVDSCGCDYFKLYCDRYNVRGTMSHHDGTHYLLYRIAPTYEIAEQIMDMASRGELTEDYFKRKTKSLRKHIADIYIW